MEANDPAKTERRFCAEHPTDELTLNCRTCKVRICFKCQVTEHFGAGHKVRRMQEPMGKLKCEAKSLLERVRNTVELDIAKIESFNEERERKIESSFHENVLEINATYERTIKLLTESRNSLLDLCSLQKRNLKRELQARSENDRQLVSEVQKEYEDVRVVVLGSEDLSVVEMEITCSRLEDMVERCASNGSRIVGVEELAEHMDHVRFKEQPGLDSLELGTLQNECFSESMRETTLTLEKVLPRPYSGSPVLVVDGPNGRTAVAHPEGTVEIFTAEGTSQSTDLQSVNVMDLAFLTDGRFVIRDFQDNISLYSKAGQNLNVTFKLNVVYWQYGGTIACTDEHDNIYITCPEYYMVLAFRPEGGTPFREIPCPDCKPEKVRAMNWSSNLVISDWRSVYVINDKGQTESRVNTSDERNPIFAVLDNDCIIIRWACTVRRRIFSTRDQFSICLYNRHLILLKTMTLDKDINDLGLLSLGQVPTENIAIYTQQRVYIFRKSTKLSLCLALIK